MPDIKAIQAELRAAKLDGWLFCDHHHRDPIAARILDSSRTRWSRGAGFISSPPRASRASWCTRSNRARWTFWAARNILYAGWEELHKNAAEIAFRLQDHRDAVFAGEQYSLHRAGGRRDDRADSQAQEKSGELGGPGAEIRSQLDAGAIRVDIARPGKSWTGSLARPFSAPRSSSAKGSR